MGSPPGTLIAQGWAPAASTGMSCKAGRVKPGHPHHLSTKKPPCPGPVSAGAGSALGAFHGLGESWMLGLLGPQLSLHLPKVQHHLKKKKKKQASWLLSTVWVGLLWSGLYLLYIQLPGLTSHRSTGLTAYQLQHHVPAEQSTKKNR